MKTSLVLSFLLRPSTCVLVASLALLTAAVRAPAQTDWGSALAFVGTNDYVEIADNDALDLTNNYTIECWFKAAGFGGLRGLVDKYQTPGSHGYLLRLTGTDLDFDAMTTAGLNLRTDVWYHVAAVNSNGTRRLYLNGQPVALNGSSYAVVANNDPLRIGVDYSTRFFSGQMDEVRIWNAARSEAQIQAAMYQPLTGAESNLVAYYRFDEGSGLTAYDSTSQHLDGTLVNGPVWTKSTVPTLLDLNAGLRDEGYFGAAAWGDYDNDGRLDILIMGEGKYPLARPQVWRNTGRGFVNVTDLVAPGPSPSWGFGYNGSVAWGDYDNDGRLDVLLAGTDVYGMNYISQVWRNTGNGFTNVTASVAPGLPGIGYGSVAWGDYDNDGRLDFLLTGYTGSGYVAQLWRNTGSGFTNVTATVAPGLPGVDYSSVAWGDYDNDGRLDFLLTGYTGSGYVAQLWRNTGSGFTNVTATVAPGLPGVGYSSVAWGDYDNDGRLDFLLTGYTGSGCVAQLWRNTGSGFTNVTATVAPGLPGVYQGSVAWGDYDNDGRLDFLLTGYTGSGYVAQLWRNTGNGFTNATATVAPGLPGVDYSSVAWGDYDNDGRLDFLLTGATSSSFLVQLWRNTDSTANTLPAAPTGLSVAVAGPTVTFNWNSASDAETPAPGLTYNLRVGTTPGGLDIISPQADTNGLRRLPAPGNAQQGSSRPLVMTRMGRFYWSVQTVDSAFAGSSFAPESSFTLWPMLGPDSGPVPGDTNGDGIVDSNEFAAVLLHLNGNGIVSQAELDSVLSNYFPYSPWLDLTNAAGLGGTNVTFALPNSTAGAFSVWMSTNLLDWDYLGPATPRYEFTDTNAPALPQRYYRLSWP